MATKTAEPPVIHATENDSISAYGPARSTIQERPLSRRSTAQDPRLLASLQLPEPRHDLSAGQPAAAGAAQTGAHQEPAARPLGIQPRPGILLHPPEPADQEARPEHDLPRRPWPRRSRRARPRAIWRALTPRSIPTRARTWQGCASSSNSSPFPAASAATAPRKRPARSMKAVNSATCCRMPAARPSTIPT